MKLLLVEDDLFFRQFYETKLEEYNILVETASDGNDALQKLAVMTPDVMLLDIIMPNMDGFEVLTEMGKNGLINKIPVLVFSTLGQEKDVEKAKALGAKGYINKSFFDFPNLYKQIMALVPQTT
jgi:CheY-like chemotaxis protein